MAAPQQAFRDFRHTLAISYNALRRARHTVEDVVLSYFPYHGLDPLKDFLRWWDLLVFVEGAIYQIDEENEQLAREGQQAALPSQSQDALLGVLQHRGLYTTEVAAELAAGIEYWERERRLCALMLEQPCVPDGGHDPGFGLEELQATSVGKSFDYRVLNLLLYALRGASPDSVLLEFLRVDEHLVDIGDDLVDYEGDVQRNSFNIFRGYVHLFGQGAVLKLVERISQHEARHAELLQHLPPPLREHFQRRQREAAPSDDALRWIFPQPILDEAAFRAEHAGDTSSGSESN